MTASNNSGNAMDILKGENPSSFSTAERATSSQHVWFSVNFKKAVCVGCFRIRSVQVGQRTMMNTTFSMTITSITAATPTITTTLCKPLWPVVIGVYLLAFHCSLK